MTVLRRHDGSRGVVYRQGRTITIRSDGGEVESQLDGDPGPPLPVEISIMPHAVNVMVPPGAGDGGPS